MAAPRRPTDRLRPDLGQVDADAGDDAEAAPKSQTHCPCPFGTTARPLTALIPMAKVRTLLTFVHNDEWRGPAVDLDWEKEQTRALLGQFAGMSEDDLAAI
jgi:hypothetical protein